MRRRGHLLPGAPTLLLLLSVVAPAAVASPLTDLALVTVEKKALALDQARRRGPILVDFWATWCKPCLASLPEIQALHTTYGPLGLTVVGVSIDGPRNAARVRPFAARLGLTYPIVFDEDGRLQQRFGVRGVPNAVLLDTTGTVVRRFTGYRPGEGAALARAIEAALVDSVASPGVAAGSAADSGTAR
ncbi:MAG: TlpA disulfide reductase family protein [Candidatus Eisenbacteria bacterium]